MERFGQSGFGIASLMLSISSMIEVFFLIIIVSSISIAENSIINEILGICILLCLFQFLISIGLGIAGILQKQRVRLCAVVGTLLSSAALVVVASIVAVGIVSDS